MSKSKLNQLSRKSKGWLCGISKRSWRLGLSYLKSESFVISIIWILGINHLTRLLVGMLVRRTSLNYLKELPMIIAKLPNTSAVTAWPSSTSPGRACELSACLQHQSGKPIYKFISSRIFLYFSSLGSEKIYCAASISQPSLSNSSTIFILPALLNLW